MSLKHSPTEPPPLPVVLPPLPVAPPPAPDAPAPEVAPAPLVAPLELAGLESSPPQPTSARHAQEIQASLLMMYLRAAAARLPWSAAMKRRRWSAAVSMERRRLGGGRPAS